MWQWRRGSRTNVVITCHSFNLCFQFLYSLLSQLISHLSYFHGPPRPPPRGTNILAVLLIGWHPYAYRRYFCSCRRVHSLDNILLPPSPSLSHSAAPCSEGSFRHQEPLSCGLDRERGTTLSRCTLEATIYFQI